jgi:hypothetical protein
VQCDPWGLRDVPTQADGASDSSWYPSWHAVHMDIVASTQSEQVGKQPVALACTHTHTRTRTHARCVHCLQ